jgi:hypothetical protein
MNDRNGSIPACRGHRWIFNLATCHACLNGRVRLKAAMCIAAKDMPNAMSDAAAGAIVGTTICVISAFADAIATAASGAVTLLAAMATVFARGAVGGGRRS